MYQAGPVKGTLVVLFVDRVGHLCGYPLKVCSVNDGKGGLPLKSDYNFLKPDSSSTRAIKVTEAIILVDCLTLIIYLI